MTRTPDEVLRELSPVSPEFFVRDVRATVRFYEDALGFRVVRVDPAGDAGQGPMFAIVWLEGAMLMFAHESLYPTVGGNTLAPPGLAVDIRIAVSDVDAVYQRAKAAGVEIVHDIGDRYYGLRDFVIRDNNGFRLRFASALG